MKKVLAILTLALTITGCQPEGRVYSEHQELSPKIEWLKSDIKTFKVPITDVNMIYNMSLSFRYATGYAYPSVMVKVTEKSPSGIEIITDYDLQLVNEQGEYIGEAGLDIWDSEHLVESNKKYDETGDYTYTIEQNTPVDPLPYSMEIGIILDEVK
jgi:gliding motility-associated lipoprotein GldH